ncbi:MAG: AAA family ATPase [Planctomycetota bacterium]
MAGRPQDVQMYIRRLARRYAKKIPELGSELSNLLRESPSGASPVRNAEVASIPVDHDSRLQLARLEYPVELEVEPIWDENVGGILHQFLAERQAESELLSNGISPSRSMLLYGPPGVGKTLAAKWIAVKLERPLLILDLSAVMSSYLGRTGINVRHVLDYAKGIDCVLILDEFDAIAKRRDDVGEVGELKRLVTVILQEVDDWPESGILLAATNHHDLLDPAVWRRFDMVVEFPMPTGSYVREAVVEFLGAGAGTAGDLVGLLGIVFEGESFSGIERQIMQARRQAVISSSGLADVLQVLIKDRCKTMGLKHRKEVAISLCVLGYSQRRVSSLTGLSRDTIRREMVEQ